MGLSSGGYNGQHMKKPFYKILSRARKQMLKENIDFGYISSNGNGFRSQLYQFNSSIDRWKRRIIGSGSSNYVGEFYISKQDNEEFNIKFQIKRKLDEKITARFEKSLESILKDNNGTISIE